MRVLRDVVVDRVSRDELLVISQVPAIVGEEMTLDLVGAGTTLELRVSVIESRPVIIEGAVRHRVRLMVIQPGAEIELPTTSPVADLETNAGAEAL
jgi:hypothetical protein